MLRIVLLALVPLVLAQGQFRAQNQQNGQTFDAHGFDAQQGIPTTRRPFHPPAQVHYVNIGPKLDGDYKFGYDTGKGPSGQSFREEVRLPDGTVQGAYGYVDENGRQRIVKYTAGKDGFKVDESTSPDENGPAAPRPRAQPVQQQPRRQAAPQPQQHQQPAAFAAHQPRLITIQQRPRQQQPQFQPQPQPQLQSQQQFQPQPQPQAQPQFQPQGQPQQFPSQRQRQPKPRFEEEVFGPAVIDAALLSYNIGSRRN